MGVSTEGSHTFHPAATFESTKMASEPMFDWVDELVYQDPETPVWAPRWPTKVACICYPGWFHDDNCNIGITYVYHADHCHAFIRRRISRALEQWGEPVPMSQHEYWAQTRRTSFLTAMDYLSSEIPEDWEMALTW